VEEELTIQAETSDLQTTM